MTENLTPIPDAPEGDASQEAVPMPESVPTPKRVMGIFAHPDDPEFFCGGTFALWASQGMAITFVLATSGDKGTSDPDMTPERLIAIREEEERAAAAQLGVTDVVFLRYPDGELTPSHELKRDIVRMIRLRQPDIVVTNDSNRFWFGGKAINHTDHRVIGEVVLDAVYPASQSRLYFPELERDEYLPPHKVHQIYIARAALTTTKVDVTDTIETKIRALREHKSQIQDMDGMAERQRTNIDAESPLDQPRYTEPFHVITYER